MLPSQFAEATGRPSQFLALHFAKSIGIVALPLHKEQPGYILNSLLVPFLEAAQQLLVKEVADVETIDKTWMIGTGAPLGPFAILDVVGINTAYNISAGKAKATGNELYGKIAQMLQTQYIDQGKLGRETGEGFYKYPNPSFAQQSFLQE